MENRQCSGTRLRRQSRPRIWRALPAPPVAQESVFALLRGAHSFYEPIHAVDIQRAHRNNAQAARA